MCIAYPVGRCSEPTPRDSKRNIKSQKPSSDIHTINAKLIYSRTEDYLKAKYVGQYPVGFNGVSQPHDKDFSDAYIDMRNYVETDTRTYCKSTLNRSQIFNTKEREITLKRLNTPKSYNKLVANPAQIRDLGPARNKEQESAIVKKLIETSKRGKSLDEWRKSGSRVEIYDPKIFMVDQFIVNFLKEPKSEASDTRVNVWKKAKAKGLEPDYISRTADDVISVAEVKSTVPIEIVLILRKSSFERTQADGKILFTYMRNIKAFEDLSDFLLGQLCLGFRLLAIKANVSVFNQGDIGTAWYIILSGSCKVLLTKTGKLEDSYQAGFGDLALVNDKPRTASIVTITNCELCVVEKIDYSRILKVFHQSELTEKVMFMKKLPLFKSFEEYALKPLSALLRWQIFQPNQVIIEEGTPLKNFIFIRNGIAIIYKKMEGSSTLVKIKVLREGDFFGEEAVLDDGESGVEMNSSYTLKASFQSEGVKIGLLSCLDAKALFVNQLSIIAKLNPKISLNNAYIAQTQRNTWKKDRKQLLDAIARQQTQDPNMTSKKFSENRKIISWK